MRGIGSRAKIVASVIALAATLAACGSSKSEDSSADSNTPKELPTLHFGAYPGTQSVPLLAMTDQKIDEKHGFKLDVKSFQTPAALNSAIVAGAVDAGFGSVTDMAIARSQGQKVVMINRLMTPAEVVLVKKDSSINTLADLKGKKVGVFSGTTTGSFSMLAAGANGANLVKNLATDITVVTAPDAAMLGLLDQGEIVAAFPTLTGAIPAILSGKYKQIANVRDDYNKTFGTKTAPGTVMVTTTEGFAKDNAQVLKAFNAALAESVTYVQNTPKIWDDYVASIKMTDSGAAALWQQMAGGAYLGTWNGQAAADETKFLQQVRDIVGVEKTFKDVPSGTFSTDYVS